MRCDQEDALETTTFESGLKMTSPFGQTLYKWPLFIRTNPEPRSRPGLSGLKLDCAVRRWAGYTVHSCIRYR